MSVRYSLDDIRAIWADMGGTAVVAESIRQLMFDLAAKVGAPDYVKTPTFATASGRIPATATASATATAATSSNPPPFLRASIPKTTPVSTGIRSGGFTVTRIGGNAEKSGLDAKIDLVRSHLNKLTDKNEADICTRVDDALTGTTTEDLPRIAEAVFEIASNNRFYARAFAGVYAHLTSTPGPSASVFQSVLDTHRAAYVGLFDAIEFVDPKQDYSRYCELNKVAERRRSLAAFYVQLALSKDHSGNPGLNQSGLLTQFVRPLLDRLLSLIQSPGKRSDVDELADCIALLYVGVAHLDAETDAFVHRIASCKTTDFPSLTNKTIFKFMDLIA